jgi:hypothetical protein
MLHSSRRCGGYRIHAKPDSHDRLSVITTPQCVIVREKYFRSILYIPPSTQRWQSPYLLLAWDRLQALYIAIETQETDSSTYYDLLRNIMKYKVTTSTCHCDVM